MVSFVTVQCELHLAVSGGVIYYCAVRDMSGSVICYWAIWAVSGGVVCYCAI